MQTIISTVSSIFTMFGSALDFVVGQPLLLCLVGLPIVGGILIFVTSLFRK